VRSLREKLAQLTSFGPPPAAAPAPEQTGFLPAVPTPHGPVQFFQQVHGPDFVQGNVRVGAARIASAATVAALALDETLAGVDPSRMLMVDTETTGLHGGSGTLPWVVGVSWFEGEQLVVRQLFLGRPGAEAPLLRMLAEKMNACSVLVTFNGKCFDWPLLRTRFVLNRIVPPPPRPHLDLLHCARRVFKRRLGGTRLQDLEVAVLGFRREGDIAGADIPAVYFDWLRSGISAQVERVLEHNAQDLVSMAAILAELCRRFEGLQPDDPAEDCLSLARVAIRCEQPARAELFARAAVERSVHPQIAFEALVLLAQGEARRRAFPEAAAWLEQAAALSQLGRLEVAQVHVLLAKVAEHGLKDLPRALRHARLGSMAETAAASVKRLERLAARIAGASQPDRKVRDPSNSSVGVGQIVASG
jgi:uncharacterized protein YprB with RNaseH-like and TPR domain